MSKSLAKVTNKSIRFLTSGCLFSVAFSLNTHPGLAQNLPTITPFPSKPERPKTLPPGKQPLNIPPRNPLPKEENPSTPGNITVKKFEFVGSTVFTSEELNKAVDRYLDRPLTFTQLLQAANRITELYVRAGYITSGAYIPAQEIRSGKVKIQILEGSLAEIKVKILQGRLSPNYVSSRIALAADRPLNINKLQEALQLLRLDPLVESLNAELTTGIKAGTNDLEVRVKGAKTFQVAANLNNNRNSSIGSFERGAEISQANLLGFGDSISVAYNNTDGSNRIDASYTAPINASNGTIGISYRYLDSKIIDPDFRRLDIEVDSQDFELTLRQPVIQKATAEATKELFLSLSATRRESQSKLLGVDFPVSPGADNQGKTRISALRFTQEWLTRSHQEVLSARSQFSLGVDAFDATINKNEPDAQFFLWRGQVVYLRLLDPPRNDRTTSPSILLRSDLQLANDALLASEQLGLGGQANVRGYSQDALLSDNGIFASAEVRLPIWQIPEVEGVLQLTPFVDFGTAWNTNRNNPDSKTLVGLGCGLLWEMGENLSARFDVGIPLTDIDAKKRTWQDKGIYFSIDYGLF